MKLYLLADVGSTWTKLAAVDSGGNIVAQASMPTTADTDVMLGFNAALAEIKAQAGGADYLIYACSSAAGGLVMVACGLVPELTGQAARMAVLGAGAKVLKVFGYDLNQDDLDEIDALRPDMLLLAGGTDGGNRQILLGNAQALAENVAPLPIVLAGNRNIAHQAAEILTAAGFPVEITGNVMPELGELKIDPAREAIRKIFLEHIVHAKGMDNLSRQLAGPLLPTPAAVMAGGRLLAGEWDDLLMVDIGGATTDVYSYGAQDIPPGMMRKGLPPPWDMRTVEADIGMRHSLSSLIEQVGLETILASAPDRDRWREELRAIKASPGRLIKRGLEGLETILGRHAVQISITRHGGSLERIYSPMGHTDLLEGKDLRGIKTVVGIGGVLVNTADPRGILDFPALGLLPNNPELMVDKDYIMAAAGLLADREPVLASAMLKNSLASL